MWHRPDKTLNGLRDDLARRSGAEADVIARRLLDHAESLSTAPNRASIGDPVGLVERWLAVPKAAVARSAEQGVFLAFDRLTQPARTEIQARLGSRLIEHAAEAIRSDDHAQITAAIAVLRRTRDISLIPPAAGLLGRVPPALSGSAIAAICVALEGWRTHPSSNPARIERAVAAILSAADEFGTGPQHEILIAALLALDAPTRAGVNGRLGAAWLARTSDALGLRLRSALSKLPGPLGIERAWDLLPARELGRAAASRMQAPATPDELARLISLSHLSARPARTGTLRARTDRDGQQLLMPDPSEPLDQPEARGLPRWLCAIGIQQPARDQALEPLLANHEPRVRLAAARLAGDELLNDFTLDHSEPVARSAMLRVHLRDASDGATEPAGRRRAELLARSPHASVRRIAARALDQGPMSPVALVALRREATRNPAALLDRLAQQIEGDDPVAVRIASRLRFSDRLIGPFARAMRHDDPRLVSEIASALAQADAPEAGQLLGSALTHADPRVRANAVESIGARHRRLATGSLELLPDDEHHRPASSSVRQMLLAGHASPDEAERVRTLLASSDPGRRAAGLWLAERSVQELKPLAASKWGEIASLVAESARHAESVQERARATRCARRMLAAAGIPA